MLCQINVFHQTGLIYGMGYGVFYRPTFIKWKQGYRIENTIRTSIGPVADNECLKIRQSSFNVFFYGMAPKPKAQVDSKHKYDLVCPYG